MKPIQHSATPWTAHSNNNPDYIDIDGACGTRITSVSLDVSGIDFNQDAGDTPENEILINRANAAFIVKACNRYDEMFAQFKALLMPNQDAMVDHSAAVELLCQYLREDAAAREIQTYLSEFPNFGLLDVTLPNGFYDVSCDHDSMPSFSRELANGQFLRLWIDFKESNLRETSECARFHLSLHDRFDDFIKDVILSENYSEICLHIEKMISIDNTKSDDIVSNQTETDDNQKYRVATMNDSGLMYLVSPDIFDTAGMAQEFASSQLPNTVAFVVGIGSVFDKVICKNIELLTALSGIADASQKLFDTYSGPVNENWIDLDGWITSAREVSVQVI